jgi:hypothetical protein
MSLVDRVLAGSPAITQEMVAAAMAWGGVAILAVFAILAIPHLVRGFLGKPVK